VNTKFLGWGTAFLEFDNDGWKDLVVANGHVYPEVDTAHTKETYKQPRLLYWNRADGQYFDLSSHAGPGISDTHSSRGLTVGDLDNDGSEEIVIVNMSEQPSLLKTFASRGASLTVRAITAGRDAIGARVTVTASGHKQIDEVHSGGPTSHKTIFACTSGWAAPLRPKSRSDGWTEKLNPSGRQQQVRS